MESRKLMKMKSLVLWLLPLLMVGCATTVTNLTPRQQTRNATGLYPFEVAFDSNQHSLCKDTITAQVVVGLESYPMRPTPLIANRWETLVPVPADKDYLSYQFKFDYQYLAIPQRHSDSKMSPPYQLKIINK